MGGTLHTTSSGRVWSHGALSSNGGAVRAVDAKGSTVHRLLPTVMVKVSFSGRMVVLWMRMPRWSLGDGVVVV